MADEEHIKRLKQGVAEWNRWRKEERPDVDLSGLELPLTELTGANLSDARLSAADLSGAKLDDADLSESNLSRADLAEANLRGANLTTADLIGALLRGADLRGAKLGGADLSGAQLVFANLSGANLRGAFLDEANLARSDLSGADLRGADLSNASLHSANLNGANLRVADLRTADLSQANLSNANLTGATLHETIFADVDLTGAIGLEKCCHMGPSTIDHRTLQKSNPLPLTFLRGVGLPDALIEYLPSLSNQAIQYYSCFISYSVKDDEFAHRIHADLQNNGVRCWFAPHDMKIGEKIHDSIDAAIRLRDKVLLILSEHSIKSDWVEDEVTKAFEEERRREQIVLFPLRLDNAVMDTAEAWAAKLRARHIGDFRGWKDHDGYKQSFERVLRDLECQAGNAAAPKP